MANSTSSASLLSKYQEYLDRAAGLNRTEDHAPLSLPPKFSVGIVGGGMSGLYSAILLQQHFPGVVKWVESLKQQNIIEHIGRVIFFVSESSSKPFEHRDLDADTPAYTDHNIEFIHIRPNTKRGFYIWDPQTKRKHYVNSHACFFNDQDWHGGEFSMEQEYGLRIDCKFTQEFKKQLGIDHLGHY